MNLSNEYFSNMINYDVITIGHSTDNIKRLTIVIIECKKKKKNNLILCSSIMLSFIHTYSIFYNQNTTSIRSFYIMFMIMFVSPLS